MLQRLLEAVARGGTHTRSELARELGVSQELLQEMIDNLARRGYLRPMGEGCDERCTTCMLQDTCAIGSPGRMWALTEKGLGLTRGTRNRRRSPGERAKIRR